MKFCCKAAGLHGRFNAGNCRHYRKIAEETIGRPLKISQMCGGTDARMFADRSVIVMHSVNGENAHGDGEYVEIESVKKLLEIEKKFIDACIAGI